jgi:hypothetical protein
MSTSRPAGENGVGTQLPRETEEGEGKYHDALSRVIFHNAPFATLTCKRNIEMTPLCKIEVTHRRVLGSREMRHGGVVDEQAGVQPP